MSRFSGKCDFGDSVSIFGKETMLKADIHVGKHKLRIENELDLAKYYPYLTVLSAGDNTTGHSYIVLSQNPYIDTEENDHLGWLMDDAKAAYRKAKRDKTEITPEYIKNRIYGFNDELKDEIAKRVAKDGMKATADGLHTTMAEYYRDEWVKELIRLGMKREAALTWVYGFGRACEMMKKERENDNES